MIHAAIFDVCKVGSATQMNQRALHQQNLDSGAGG